MASESAHVDQPTSSIAALEAKVASLEAAVETLMKDTRAPEEDAPACQEKKEKKPRAKSAYNVFMSEELARLKVSEPEWTHNQRFAKAVYTWQSKKEERASAPAADAPAAKDE
jgi:outer membrane murein-binding lipoprotein Lpp